MVVVVSRNQLFVVTEDAFCAASQDEVDATVVALKEAGLYALPFPTIDVRIAGDCVSRYDAHGDPEPHVANLLRHGLLFRKGDKYFCNFGDGHWVDFRNISLEHSSYVKHIVTQRTADGMIVDQDSTVTRAEFGEAFAASETERDAVADMLITLLATRNAVKNVEHNSRLKRGLSSASKPGSTRRYEYVTTISVPREMEDDPEHAGITGQAKAPHLRRGHVRRQHHGPRNVMVKSIWVAPVFVNADREWVSQRRAYNVSL